MVFGGFIIVINFWLNLIFISKGYRQKYKKVFYDNWLLTELIKLPNPLEDFGYGCSNFFFKNTINMN